MVYVLLIIYATLASGGMALVKLGGDKLKFNLNISTLSFQFSWTWLIGIACYIISFAMWMYIINKFEKLNHVYILGTCAVYIAILIISVVLLHEKMQILQIIGVILILIGMILFQIGK